MFEIRERDAIRDRLIGMAQSDDRVVAAAAVGSLAHDEGDRWSDIDLMLAVSDDVAVAEVLEAWTRTLVAELQAVHLFDLPSGPLIYRVFLLPNSLELDLSFVAASAFRPGGPK